MTRAGEGGKPSAAQLLDDEVANALRGLAGRAVHDSHAKPVLATAKRCLDTPQLAHHALIDGHVLESEPHDRPAAKEAAQCAANAAARGVELMAGLESLKAKHELVGDVRGKGLMAALELVSDRAKKSAAAKDVVQKVYDTAYEAGVMVRTSGANVIISPPLIITAADVQKVVSALDEGLSAAEGK